MAQTVVGRALQAAEPRDWEQFARQYLSPLVEEMLRGTSHEVLLDGDEKSILVRWEDGPRTEAIGGTLQAILGAAPSHWCDPLQAVLEFSCGTSVALHREISATARALAVLVLHQRRGCPHCHQQKQEYDGPGFEALVLRAHPRSAASYDHVGRGERLERHAEILGGLCDLPPALAASEDVLTAQLCLMGHVGGLVALDRTLTRKGTALPSVRLPRLRGRRNGFVVDPVPALMDEVPSTLRSRAEVAPEPAAAPEPAELT